MTINFQYYPKSQRITSHLSSVTEVFKEEESDISSQTHSHESNKVLAYLANGLIDLGYRVEKSKKKEDLIEVPVLFGMNNKLEKSFYADAYNEDERSVIEVEAGRGVLNNQFLKDLFQACMMQDVDFLTIAIRNEYKTKKKNGGFKINYDFEEVCKFFDALYSTDRITLPLKGILIIGY